MRKSTILAVIGLVSLLLAVVAPSAVAQTPAATSALVSVGSPTNQHPQNAQNEPSLAVDSSRPNVLAEGANDLVDMQPCSRLASTTAGACSFPLGTFNLGVGLSSVSFSFDRGRTWVQPTYQGLTAADCSPTVEPCTPHPGPIHTVPNFFENGLRSRSDTGVSFGPAPVNGHFSWANGSRPFFVPAHVAASAGLDKEQIWADNAESSPFFGQVYVCYSDFHSFSGGNAFPLFPMVATSGDGGVTWHAHSVGPPIASAQRGAFDGCTVRTDSHGRVYAFFTHFSGTSLQGFHTVATSDDGGTSWAPPRDVVAMTDPCFRNDPVTGRCIEDGNAGARTDLAAMPSVDIANGAPTGADATDEIVDAWSDGSLGPDHEVTMLSYSTDRGRTFSTPTPVSAPADRSAYSAPAISPDGRSVYVTYMAWGQPFQATTANPRPEHGVLRMASIGANGVPGAFATLYDGPFGDARGSSQGRILYNEFLGDYVYAIATRTYGMGVWTDVRRAADCPAMDAWRQRSVDAGHLVFPAPWALGGVGDCLASFGNSDIFGATTG